jgi:hypothetical protein
MDVLQAGVFFGVLTGLVSAGLTASLWEFATDESPRFRLLFDGDFLTPLKVIVVVLAAPYILLSHAVWWLVARPSVGAPMFLLGLLWCFVQGVFILTQVFNIS